MKTNAGETTPLTFGMYMCHVAVLVLSAICSVVREWKMCGNPRADATVGTLSTYVQVTSK